MTEPIDLNSFEALVPVKHFRLSSDLPGIFRDILRSFGIFGSWLISPTDYSRAAWARSLTCPWSAP